MNSKPNTAPVPATLTPAQKLLKLIGVVRSAEDAETVIKLEAEAGNPLALTILKLVKLATTVVGSAPRFLRDDESLVLESGEEFIKRVYTTCKEILDTRSNPDAVKQWMRLSDIRWELVDVGLAPPLKGYHHGRGGPMSSGLWREFRAARSGSGCRETLLFALASGDIKPPVQSREDAPETEAVEEEEPQRLALVSADEEQAAV
ncbi:MAG: hypothetical protein NUV56_01505 [Candidatus Uhrbacteria bacterium]|nr:hypothetical protein [Candidatus Uhrbacteria bacterium]